VTVETSTNNQLGAIYTPEREEFRRIIRDFLEAKSPESEVRRLMATTEGYDPSVWGQLAGELGLPGLIIPEEYGGQGFGFTELAVVFEEMGRALLCSPFLSTVALAATAILHSGDESAKAELLPLVASGSLTATVACAEDSGRWDQHGIAMQASADGNGYRLTGTKTFVIDGHTADVIIVAARTGKGISLFHVRADAQGLAREPLATMDETRKQAKLNFSNTPATLLGAEGAGWHTLQLVLDLTAVALAAEQVGGAQRVLEMSVEYAKTRVQFGRPIGYFQAIKHKCANILIQVEAARSAAYYASWCAAEVNAELGSAAAIAKSYCSEAYYYAAKENIQIHGGVGFAWEHPAHLYFKRAKSTELLFGDPAYHRELLMQRLAGPARPLGTA
jgi:alkylation response protein AidB-like acyl-CoA dehydrogenase